MPVEEPDFPDKDRFYVKLEEALAGKRLDNPNYISAAQYAKFIEQVKEAKQNRSLSTSKRRLQRFAVLEDLCERIKEGHTDTHKERNRMVAACNVQYKNVTQEAIRIFLELCPGCLRKTKMQKRRLAVKPMVFSKFNDRCQID
ncbi:hypothetical protein ONE63_008108 [Megalurothrips usitatus]|uniref:Uncharacterized protein n=1 Tax=Megalurothrips usitatus TaxID=439358 RepID=A0AAV7XPC5_9NEOP|nr:hypothetical protein ONE63_008108 [Megalurothrips usitatus]